VDFVYLFLQI